MFAHSFGTFLWAFLVWIVFLVIARNARVVLVDVWQPPDRVKDREARRERLKNAATGEVADEKDKPYQRRVNKEEEYVGVCGAGFMSILVFRLVLQCYRDIGYMFPITVEACGALVVCIIMSLAYFQEFAGPQF